ncbi:hypothetical protein D3C72_1745990 [compost metagenome]
MLERRLGRQEGAVHVDGLHLLPVRVGEVFDRVDDLDAGVRDQDVDTAVGGRDLVDALVHGVFAGDVHRHAHCLAARLLDFAGNGVRAGLVQVGDRDGRACAGEGQGDLFADAAGGAGHDGDFSIQLAHAATSGSGTPARPRTVRMGAGRQ